MRFGLPYPPGKNALYRTIVRGKRAMPIKSAEYREYDAKVEAIWPRQPAETFAATPKRVELRFFRPRRAGDIDGPIAALFDVLNGRAWGDDSQVVELHVYRGDDKHQPRVEVQVDDLAHPLLTPAPESILVAAAAPPGVVLGEPGPITYVEPETHQKPEESPSERIRRLATPNMVRP